MGASDSSTIQSSQSDMQLLGAHSERNQIIKVEDKVMVPYLNIGLLKFICRDEEYFGSAFQIGPTQLMTCAHNCYQRGVKAKVDSMVYYPFAAKGKPISIRKMIYDEKYQELSETKSLKWDFAYLILKEEYRTEGVHFSLPQPKQPRHDNPLQIRICGIPGKQINNKASYASFGLYEGQGQYRIAKNLLQHSIQTKKGMSGSPMFYFSNNHYYVIGIHCSVVCQKEKQISEGCNLNPQILEKVCEWRKKYNRNYSSQNKKKIEERIRKLKFSMSFAQTLIRKNNYFEAEEKLVESIEDFRLEMGEDSHEYLAFQCEIGRLFVKRGLTREMFLKQKYFEKAMKQFQRCEIIAQKTKNNNILALLLSRKGEIDLHLGRIKMAIEKSEKALKYLDKLGAKQSKEYAEILCNLGYKHRKNQDQKKSLDYYERAVYLKKKMQVECANELESMGDICVGKNREKSIYYYTQCVEELSKTNISKVEKIKAKVREISQK